MMTDDEHSESPRDEEEIESMSPRDAYTDRLISEPPRCPECSKILQDRIIEKCDYCGFTFSYLAKMLPSDGLPILKNVTDFSELLNDSDVARIKKNQNTIEKRYPQFHHKVCVLPLQESVKVQEMGLWMLNSCPQEEGAMEIDKYWEVLLLIDTQSMKSSVTLGYQAEVFFDDDSLWKLINRLNGRMRKGDITGGICRMYAEMLEMLDGSKCQDRRQFKIFRKRR